jgi:hypothetical protein
MRHTMATILTKRTERFCNMRLKRRRKLLQICLPVVMEDRQRHGNLYLEMQEMEKHGNCRRARKFKKNWSRGDGGGYSISLDDMYDIN